MLNPWLLAMRPKTLPASVSPILLGSALAFDQGLFRWSVFGLAMICALALQIAVNFANDYFDAKSGVDTEKRLGPQRATQSGLISSQRMLMALLLVCLVAFISGMGLVWLSDWVLLVLGIASLVAVFAYSGGPFPLASHGLGEITVLLFFGLLAVGGTYYAHSLHITASVLGYGVVAGLISAAIMLVNNIRDIPTDAPAGKHTLAVMLGDQLARELYKWLLVFALVMHLLVSFNLGFASFVPLLVVAPMARRLIQQSRQLQGAELNQLLARTAVLEMAYCLLASMVLLVMRWL
ncbi:1,4-dihydroxy-2-naphthoate polyprenyltransferase [Reinekea sp. G2M2-21]|uniref:1,4-dihydroxy-2-naphthoate polyprenyltransferase n=1 Tax=Reinekea sp. G2M2-21 TaxID=2788942 RepID=UPI001E2A8B5B|nr:1,4-dihydroxy-2-naphthoate polyprenyltransferase [Reinekea sp. G2M2-21]